MKLMAKATVASNIHQKVKKYAKSRKLVLKNYGYSTENLSLRLKYIVGSVKTS